MSKNLSNGPLGPYRILREIGHGGMGAVYLAARDDGEYRKQVAIKLIRPRMSTDFLLRRFRNERQILANLDHPNIARLLDGGTTPEGLPYLVMEYIEGEPIDSYCDRYSLPVERRLELFRAVCAAVHYAHQNQVVHRDLKPGNILITADGVPKLLDFGIAKLLAPEPSTQASERTATAVRLMTPEYASPEQIRGLPVSPASDIYSLGVALYQLLTGHLPYRIKSGLPHELAQAICEMTPEKPSTAVGRVAEAPTANGIGRVTISPEEVCQRRASEPGKLRRRLKGDLDNIVLMALRKEPERRYQSVEQLSEDLCRHMSDLPVRARRTRPHTAWASFSGGTK